MTENDRQMTFNAEPGGQSVISTQIFDAPCELVFKACTDPSLIPEWWGPKIRAITVEEMDVRPGGIWRHGQRGPEGEFAFKACITP
jgi:uncharacterized protein YndB with AHSA1/START domain